MPGSDLGTFDGSPWLLQRVLAQLGNCMSFHFEHLRRVCEVLGRLTDPAWAWAAPCLAGDLSLYDDDELFCQDLEEVIQNLNSFVEYHAAALPLVPASIQPPVAPQLPVVRQYSARFSEALALNVAAALRPVPDILATLAISGSDSELKNALPEQQLVQDSSPGPPEPPALSTSGCTNPGLLGPASSQPTEMAPKPVLVLSESA